MRARQAGIRTELLGWLASALAAAFAAPAVAVPFGFETLPQNGVVNGGAGATVGWGYRITNPTTDRWLALASLDAGTFLDGTPEASLFDFPILAPGSSLDVLFDGIHGLFAFTWSSSAPAGATNSGVFEASADWYDGDPFAGGSFLEVADLASVPYSTQLVPEASCGLLLAAGLGAIAARRRSRRSFALRALAGVAVASASGVALAQAPLPCASLATVDEFTGWVDYSWSIDQPVTNGNAQMIHQGFVSVHLRRVSLGVPGFPDPPVFYGQPTNNAVRVDGTLTDTTRPEVTTVHGAGPDVSGPTQGGINLTLDLATCEYEWHWGVDLAAVTVTNTTPTGQTTTTGGYNMGFLQSQRRSLGSGDIAHSSSFTATSLFSPPPTGTDYYVVVDLAAPVFLEPGVQVPAASASWRFIPGPPTPVELVLSAVPDDWIPEAGKDESDPGNFALVDAYLRNADGTSPLKLRARQITFQIAQSSHEPGIALNEPKTNAKTTADLQFDAQQNSTLPVLLDISGAEHETAKIRPLPGPVPVKPLYDRAEAYVSAYDYGAYGEVTVFAELENGETVTGLVRGIAGETTLLLPRRAGPFVADQWKADTGVPSLPDDDDAEKDPVASSVIDGDGFALYEEYRGMMVTRDSALGPVVEHKRLDPKKRDLFILDKSEDATVGLGIRDFASATQLAVTKVTETQLAGPTGMLVNFNHSGSAPHRVDQHGVRVEYDQFSDLPYDGAYPRSTASDPWTPKDIEKVLIQGRQKPTALGVARVRSGAQLARVRSTVVHELLHAVGVDHHGDNDTGCVLWAEVGGKIMETRLDQDCKDTGIPPYEITVFLENGTTPATAADFGGLPHVLYVGDYNQQHSGREICAMRYDAARATPSFVGSTVRLWTGSEVNGLSLCNDKTGTGVNDATRLLREGLPSRYGDATRGDCEHQIVVNDAAP
jgi:hypothetical protein